MTCWRSGIPVVLQMNCGPPLPPQFHLQAEKVSIEAYLAKLSVASRKAEQLVQEIETQGASKSFQCMMCT